MSEHLDPQEAQELLDHAGRLGAATRSGASWPYIAGLLGMGGASSMGLLALAWAPQGLTWLPMLVLFAWIGALFAIAAVFGRASKRGFGRRWTLTILIWGAVWVVGVFGTSWWFAGQLWFLAGASVALTATTLTGAWIEARR